MEVSIMEREKIWKEAGVWQAMYKGEVSGAFTFKAGAQAWLKEQKGKEFLARKAARKD
jgi:hypothetical protein